MHEEALVAVADSPYLPTPQPMQAADDVDPVFGL